MPKAQANKSRSNTLYAHLADIQVGWAKAPLTGLEKRCLFMRYAVDWELKYIASHEGIHSTTATRRVEAAVGKITGYLNGWSLDQLEEEYGDHDQDV